MKLTDEFVREVPGPKTGSAMKWDTGHDSSVRGFGVRISAPTKRTPEGARSFFFSYRVDGYDRRVTIGEFPTMKVGVARDHAAELRKRVLAGEDPAAEKRENRESPTMQDLVDRYITDHLHMPSEQEGKGDPRTNDVRRMLNEIADLIGRKRRVKDVHVGDVEAMHRKITESGRPVRANRILAIASKAFSLSLQPRACEDKPWRNPLSGTRWSSSTPILL